MAKRAEKTTPFARYRQERGLTLAALRKELRPQVDLSESQLSRIESDGTTSLDTALNLAGATGLPVQAFVRVA